MAIVANAEVIKRLVILIADSRAHSRSLLRSMLLQLEVKQIHEAIDGAAALDTIVTVNPDILIVDWDIPVLSASELLRRVRSPDNNPSPDLPIIVLSSRGQSEYVEEALRHRAEHFMLWPISPKALQQRFVDIVTKARKTALARKRDIQPAEPAPGTDVAVASPSMA
jgi:two-component system chemotaxis response regulator CheY